MTVAITGADFAHPLSWCESIAELLLPWQPVEAKVTVTLIHFTFKIRNVENKHMKLQPRKITGFILRWHHYFYEQWWSEFLYEFPCMCTRRSFQKRIYSKLIHMNVYIGRDDSSGFTWNLMRKLICVIRIAYMWHAHSVCITCANAFLIKQWFEYDSRHS